MKLSDLSPRQRQVLGYVSKGLTAEAIAETLGLATCTVWGHLTLAMRKVAPGAPRGKRLEAAKRWFRQQRNGTPPTVEPRPMPRVKDVPPEKAPARTRESCAQTARECRIELEKWSERALAASTHQHKDHCRGIADEWANVVLALRLVPYPVE